MGRMARMVRMVRIGDGWMGVGDHAGLAEGPSLVPDYSSPAVKGVRRCTQGCAGTGFHRVLYVKADSIFYCVGISSVSVYSIVLCFTEKKELQSA